MPATKNKAAPKRPTLKDYQEWTGYTNDERIRVKLTKLFGNAKARPTLQEFVIAVRKDLEKEASGREITQEKLDQEEQRTRKDAAQAENYEIKNGVLKGELVNGAEVDSFEARKDLVLRTNFLGLPARIASELVGEDEREIILRLDAEVRASLNSSADELEEAYED